MMEVEGHPKKPGSPHGFRTKIVTPLPLPPPVYVDTSCLIRIAHYILYIVA
jgi:hypothetical protein